MASKASDDDNDNNAAALSQLCEMFGDSEGWTRETLELLLMLHKGSLDLTLQCLLENSGHRQPETVIQDLIERDAVSCNDSNHTISVDEEIAAARQLAIDTDSSYLYSDNHNGLPQEARHFNLNQRARDSDDDEEEDIAKIVVVEGAGLEMVNGRYFYVEDEQVGTTDEQPSHHYKYSMHGDWSGVLCIFTLEKEGNCWFLSVRPSTNHPNGTAAQQMFHKKINLYWTAEKKKRRYPPLSGWIRFIPSDDLPGPFNTNNRNTSTRRNKKLDKPPKLRYPGVHR